MFEIVFASGNEHKVYEVNKIAESFKFRLIKPVAGFNPDENGKTFEANATIKAQAAALLGGGKFFLADDSGLCVQFLQGAPGIHSSRYANTPQARIEKLLNVMQGVPQGERAAKFTCSMVLVDAAGNVLHKTVGNCRGRIGYKPEGNNGFGYDPIFVLEDGRTMAQLSDDEKNLISHRGRALIDMLIWIKLNSAIMQTQNS